MKQKPNFFSEFYSEEITPAGLANFCSRLHDPKELSDFVSNLDPAMQFLESLIGTDMKENYLAQILCIPDVVFHLVESGKIDRIWFLISNLSNMHLQVQILCTSEIVFIVTKNGKANEVLRLIKKLPDTMQVKICKIPYAVFGMAKFGDAEKTLAMIMSLPKRNHASVLTTSHVIYGLVDNLNLQSTEKLLKWIHIFPNNVISEILASHLAVFGLVKNGRTEQVVSWLHNFSHGQLDKVLNAAYVLPVLNENVPETEMKNLMAAQLKKREDRNRKELMSAYRSGNRYLH